MKSSKMIIGLLIAFFLVNTAGLWMIISETKKQTTLCAETAATLSDIQKQNSAIQEQLTSFDAAMESQSALMQTAAELDYMHATLYLDNVVDALINQTPLPVDDFNEKMLYVSKISQIGKILNPALWDLLHHNTPFG